MKKIFKNKVLLSIAIVICIAFIVLLILFMPDIKGQIIKRAGVDIEPDADIEPLTDIVYLQNDDRWKDEYLGETDFTLESQGCLTCVIAMNLNYFGYDLLPSDVNNVFIQRDVYTDDGELLWYKINSVYSNITYEYEKVFNSKMINEDLQSGWLPIVKVRYKKTGIYHWVLIVGANENEFLILDPLEQSQEPIPLREHGKVYAYRVLKLNN